MQNVKSSPQLALASDGKLLGTLVFILLKHFHLLIIKLVPTNAFFKEVLHVPE